MAMGTKTITRRGTNANTNANTSKAARQNKGIKAKQARQTDTDKVQKERQWMTVLATGRRRKRERERERKIAAESVLGREGKGVVPRGSTYCSGAALLFRASSVLATACVCHALLCLCKRPLYPSRFRSRSRSLALPLSVASVSVAKTKSTPAKKGNVFGAQIQRQLQQRLRRQQ